LTKFNHAKSTASVQLICITTPSHPRHVRFTTHAN